MLLRLIDPLIFSVVIKPYIHYYPRDGASLSDRVLCDIIRAIFLSIARPSSVYNPSFFNRNLSVVASYIFILIERIQITPSKYPISVFRLTISFNSQRRFTKSLFVSVPLFGIAVNIKLRPILLRM